MELTREKIEELKRLAKAATPGEWLSTGVVVAAPAEGGMDYILEGLKSDKNYSTNLAFVAALNPKTVSALLALAERALEPQGQALPELPGRDEVHHYYWEHPIQGQTFYKYASHWSTGPAHAKPLFTADQMHAYARAYASQLALPAGPVPEGWIAWNGGGCPVPGETWVKYILRDGDKAEGRAECLRWKHIYKDSDIMAYRPHAYRSPAVAQPVADFKTQPTAEQVATVRERLEAAGFQKVAQPVADERAALPALPASIREALAFYADSTVDYITFDPRHRKEQLKAHLESPDWQEMGEDRRGHERFVVTENKACIALEDLTQWEEAHAALGQPAEEGGKS